MQAVISWFWIPFEYILLTQRILNRISNKIDMEYYEFINILLFFFFGLITNHSITLVVLFVRDDGLEFYRRYFNVLSCVTAYSVDHNYN